MLSNQQKAAIHIAKTERGISDPDYRALLTRVTGTASSADPRLGESDYQAIMKAINGIQDATPEADSPASQRSEGANKKGGCNAGWKDAQVRKFRQYVRFCKMDAAEGRQLIYRVAGEMHEESPHLKQVDFDDVMATIEAELEVRVQSGQATVPANIELRYWRKRHPGQGAVNTRESHKIFELWKELKGYLDSDKQNMQYLFGFAAHTCRLSRAKAIEELSSTEALKVIDALKRRLIQERRSVGLDIPKDELAEVPF